MEKNKAKGTYTYEAGYNAFMFIKIKFLYVVRYGFMELKDVEMSLGIQFPKLFHEINKSGMMDYLLYSRKWVENKIVDKDYVRREDFFGEFMGDCRLIAFEDLQSAYNELYECLNFDLEIYPEHQSINPLYSLIPFACKISGDKYCFLYENGKDEPKVVVYGHDTGDIDLWANDFEEFVDFQVVEEVVMGNKTIYSDYIKAHILWLNDNHKQVLSKVPIKDIWEHLPEPQEFNIWL